MKKTGFILVIISSLFITITSQAQDYKTGVGIRISSQDAAVNNSITLKYFLSEAYAVEGMLSFGDPVSLGALLQRHTPILANGLKWFWGAGAYVGFAGLRTFGLHGALGMDYKVPTLPLNLSIDWKPEINMIKEFSFEPAAVGLSARFVLK